jgi:hypothetical protein
LIAGGADPTGWRLPGPGLERTVATLIADHITAARERHELLTRTDLRGSDGLAAKACNLERQLLDDAPGCLGTLTRSGVLAPDRITVELDPTSLANALDVLEEQLALRLSTITAPVRLRRRGVEAKLVIGTKAPSPDPVLRKALAEAHAWATALRSGTPLKGIAMQSGHHDVLIRTRGQLAFLSPKIQTAIRDGTQPPDLTLKRILSRPVPLDWHDQERLYSL